MWYSVLNIMATLKKKSHLGLGLVAGSIIGMAAGFFLQSKDGQKLLKDGQKKAEKLQAALMKELSKDTHLTKKRYEALVDKMMKYYMTGKQITKTEAPAIRSFLMKKWKSIETQLKKAT